MKTKIAVIFLVLSVLASCAPVTKPDETKTIPVSAGYGVSRYFDKEAGVVCWVYFSYKAGGISCLPIEDTLLEMPK